ncbi:uncharacterized protein G2W53_024408 [Senna tora]|uniref:Uncharacterized protein n=1 Tax=Senna tora TaxID=362788 RepID=A0A834TB62_9FABA|nr:uncharacterized protein G2W53_024408 [Senna tora]
MMETPTPTPTPTPKPNVQLVPKKSSDELLRKFAEMGSHSHTKHSHLSKRRKKSVESHSDTPTALVERRSLLPPAATRRSPFLRHLRPRDIRNKSLFASIHKTWRSTIEGASRVFMEKHYHRHKRLISDIV